MTQLQRVQLVRRVLDAYPHLSSLAPADLFAEVVKPGTDDQASQSGSGHPHPREGDQPPGTFHDFGVRSYSALNAC